MRDHKAQIKQWTRQQTRLARRYSIPIIILGLISSVIAVGLAWCAAELLARILITTKSMKMVGFYLAGFVILSILRSAVLFFQEILATKAGIKAKHQLRMSLIHFIMKIGPSVLHHQSSGTLSSLMVDQIESLDGYFSRWMPASVLWVAAPLIILVFLTIVEPWLALIIGLCGLMVPIAQAIFGIGAAVAARKQFLAMTRLQARFLDRIKGIATIVLSGRTEDEAQKLLQSADELRRRTMRILRVAFLSSAAIDCAMVIAIILVSVTEGSQFVHHDSWNQISVIHALFALLLIPEFFAPLRSLALAYQDRARLNGTAESVLELPDVKAKQITAPTMLNVGTHAPEIVFDHVSFSWDEARGKAIDDISFDLKQGEILILSGKSGSGKSTIIEMLLGFIQPTAGEIRFNGVALPKIVPDALTKITTWIGQKPVIFAGTIRENILFAKPSASEEALQAALQSASIHPFLSSLPEGLDTRIGEGGYGLSGGQAQRIAIARAFLKNAPLLLLDEPTAHLDPETEKDIFETLKNLIHNRTVVLATHSTASQMFQGLRLDLHHGKLIAQTRVN